MAERVETAWPGGTVISSAAMPLILTCIFRGSFSRLSIFDETNCLPAGTRHTKKPVPFGSLESSRGLAPVDQLYGPNARTPIGTSGFPGCVFQAPVLSA